MDDNHQAEAALANAEACIARSHYDDAVKSLTVLPRNFVAGHVKCIDLMSSITFQGISDSHLIPFFTYMTKIKGKLHSSSEPERMLESIAEVILKNLRSMLEEATSNVKQAVENPSPKDKEFEIITGIPLKTRVQERFFFRCVPIMNKVVVEVFFGTKSLLAMPTGHLHVYFTTAAQFIALCVEYELDKILDRVADSIYRTMQYLLLESHFYKGHRLTALEKEMRKNFFTNPSAGEELISLLSYLAEQLSAKRCWWQLWNVVSLTYDISKSYDSPSINLLAFDSIAKTFWICKQFDFHAYCLSRAAQIDPEKYATRAITAALCIRGYEKEYNPFVTNPASLNNRATIFSALGEPETDTGALLSRLLVPKITKHADLIVLKLVQELQQKTDPTNYLNVKGYVEKLFLPSHPHHQVLVPYKELMRAALLHREVEQISRLRNRVDLKQQLTMISSSKLTDKEYVEFVEPVILQDVGTVPIEIDCKNKCVSFHHAAKKKLHYCFNMLGSIVAVRPACETVEVKDNLGSTHILPVTLPSISAADLRLEVDCARSFHLLQNECRETKDLRKKKRLELIQEEKEINKEKLIRVEKEKQEKLFKARAAEKMVGQREQIRKKALLDICKLLMRKYPSFKLDETLCSKQTSAFEDEVTQILADFKRQKAESSQKENLSQNLLERSLRRLEIPKRKDFNDRNKQLHMEERAAARENFLAQHRKEYDKRMAERLVLQKFQKDAENFERDIISQTVKEKSSKRDEQQLRLEQEMRRLANQ